MSKDDDISQRLLEGDTYEKAQVTVRRTFDLPLDRKIAATAGVLWASVLVGPAATYSRELVRTVEPGVDPTGVYSPRIGILALYGVLVTFTTGLLLVRHRRIVERRSLTEEQARRLVRIEDLITWFALLGATFVAVAVASTLAGAVTPGAVRTLYDHGVVLYQPSGVVRVDVRLVSLLGGVLAAALSALWALPTSGDGG
jgi:hypothetical protein